MNRVCRHRAREGHTKLKSSLVLTLIPATGQGARRPRRQEAKRLQGAEAPTNQPRAPTNQPTKAPTHQPTKAPTNQRRTKAPADQPRRRTERERRGEGHGGQPGGQPAANKRPTKGAHGAAEETSSSLAPPPACHPLSGRPPSEVRWKTPCEGSNRASMRHEGHRAHRSSSGTLLPPPSPPSSPSALLLPAREERTLLPLLRAPSLRRHAAIIPPSFRHQ